MNLATVLGVLALAIWLYLLVARGGFWLARERDDREALAQPARWPSVVAVVPARNEADVIGQSVKSLLQQDYPGAFRVVLVDDDSDDGTAATARQAAAALGASERLEVLRGAALPSGWTGKLWAQQQGVQHATASGEAPDYLLLTDADIGHAPDNLRTLVPRAERHGYGLVSLMAQLPCGSWAERFLVPAFVDTGLNFAHVDDIAEGHLLAFEHGRIGERYILGGENVLLRDLLAAIAGLSGRRAPRISLPRMPLYPLAFGAEAVARLTGKEPLLTLDGLRMSRYRMFFTSAKAERELGYRSRPYQEGVADALAWFRKAGYLT